MLARDPNGIKNPLTHTDPKPEKIDLQNPTSGVYCDWRDNKVTMLHKPKGVRFTVNYEGRTAGEVAAEITKIINHLS